MPTLKIDNFRGLIPKVDDRNVPPGFASKAENVRFDAGDLSPLRGPVTAQTFPGDIGNVFYLRDDQSGHAPKFIAFGESFQVDYLRGPTPDDSHNRFYWNVAGDSLRAITNPLDSPTPNGAAVGSGASYQPFLGYRVGIPAPTTAPAVADTTPPQEIDYGGVQNISRTSPMTVTAVGEVPFSKGAKVRIVIDPSLERGEEQPSEEVPDEEAPAETGPAPGRLWEINGLEGRVSNIGASGGSTFDIVGASGAAVGTEELTEEERLAIRIERVIEDADLESRAYVFTYVSEFDEEGPPSPASEIINVPATGGQVTLTLTDIPWNQEAHGGDRRYVNRFRLYRKVAGSQRAVFLFVGEGNFTEVNMQNGWTEETIDEASAVELGEPLPSERWYPPPPGMEGVHMMPNGFMVGYKGNALYFSEPYLPHAWNPDYKRTTDNDIIGIESYGNTLVVGTRGRPYLASGTDPASVSLRKLEVFAPLEKPRAMVDAGIGVMYPSTVGLMLIGQGGVRNITEHAFDKKTWELYLGALDRGIFHDSRAIFFARGQSPLVIDMNGDEANISRLTGLEHDVSAACIADDELALVRKNGSVYNLVEHFKRDQVIRPLTWESGMMTALKATNMGVGQVFATQYPVTVKLAHANLVNGQPDLANMVERTYVAEGPEPFRLPSDYLSREFRVSVESMYRVQMVVFASSMGELRQT